MLLSHFHKLHPYKCIHNPYMFLRVPEVLGHLEVLDHLEVPEVLPVPQVLEVLWGYC
jgi:hypothetical protein